MYLIGHAAAGVLLASGTNNPAVAFGLGWLSHYLADFIPHGDEAVGEWTKRGNQVARLALIVMPDLALIAAALAATFAARGFSPSILAAAVGALVPDVLWGIETVFKRRLFGPHHKFHYRNHNFFHWKIPFGYGLVLQAMVTIGMWRLII